MKRSEIDRPLSPLSEIVPGLWQGKRPASYEGYDLVVSCEQFLAKKPMDGYTGLVLHVPMRDEDDFEIPKRLVEVAAATTATMVMEGGRVLVHCSGGLNRSSVVTAVALQLLAYTPSRRDAVALLRERHDEFCLCNRAFERWITGDVLPTAETSAFREDGV